MVNQYQISIFCEKIIRMLWIPVAVFSACQPTDTPSRLTLINAVDPMIGTGAHGHTFPGAAVPFGMVQVSPDNGVTGWDWCSGYHYSDSIVVGFSHLHLSGTGIGDLGDIRLMPTTNQVTLTKEVNERTDFDFHDFYDHQSETAEPGYYHVELNQSKIDVSLTASRRTGVQRYIFPDGENASVVVDLSHQINWDKPTQSGIQVVNDTLICGFRYSTGWAKDQRVYFAIAFSKPYKSLQIADSSQTITTPTYDGKRVMALAQFGNAGSDNTLTVKTGISSASIAGAIKSLSEVHGKDFDEIKTLAQSAWEKELGKVKITTDNEPLRRVFYTALYHSALAPVTYSDLNQEYKTADGTIGKAESYTRYDIFSLWDTFRASHPLFTILQQDKVDDMVNSMLAHYREYGLLPVWSLLGNETNTMTGYHAIPVIADAYLKGFRGFDIDVAYEAMKKSAMQDIRGLEFYKKYGYIPSDLEVESVTKTLEYAYDDWCIAQIARALDKQEEYAYFMQRASSYRELFDPKVGFMRGKLKDGSWREPFDARRSEHRVNTDYTEGNAWQHSWFVPHDVEGLVQLMGGKEAFAKKLDSLFTIDSEITGQHISADISGLIGQYAHGNEPSHHVAYLYNFVGMPWKSQEIIRKILLTQYSEKPEGLCGNDDCGQMSAWYVFGALGFYPVNPANGMYIFGSPLFDKAEVDVGNGKKFTVIAKNNSLSNPYIQRATLNGVVLDRNFLLHGELLQGGELRFEMGSSPNPDWAASLSTGELAAN